MSRKGVTINRYLNYKFNKGSYIYCLQSKVIIEQANMYSNWKIIAL